VVIAIGFIVGVMLYWIGVHRRGRPADPDEPPRHVLHEHGADRAGHRAVQHQPYNVPVSLPGITWQGYTFTGTHIMAAVLAVVIAGLLYLFLQHTRIGKAIRAVAGNREAAELTGIPTRQVLSLAFGSACRSPASPAR